MRFDHWHKNLLIMPGAVLAKPTFDFSNSELFSLFAALLATCVASSANYLVNDWCDQETDLYHPTKSARTEITSSLNFSKVLTLYIVLAIAGLAVGYAVDRGVGFSITAFLVLGILYNVKPIRLKDVAVLDVLTESLNNPVRFLIGWFAVAATGGLAWLTGDGLYVIGAYWMCGAFLMAAKRLAEFRQLPRESAGRYRRSFYLYNEIMLKRMCVIFAATCLAGWAWFSYVWKLKLMILLPFYLVFFVWYARLSLEKKSFVSTPEKIYEDAKFSAFVVLLIAATAFFIW